MQRFGIRFPDLQSFLATIFKLVELERLYREILFRMAFKQNIGTPYITVLSGKKKYILD